MTSSERILIIRLGALGDLVLCFQAFHEIRAAHPDAEIALLTMPAFAAFAKTMPWFNRIIIDERPPFHKFEQWKKLVQQIRAFNPTRVYDLQGKFRQNVLYFLLDPRRLEWSGAATLCDYPRLWPPEPGMHFTDFIAAQLRLADVSAAEAADLAWLDAPLDGFTLPERFALLVPGCGAGRDYKRWPATHYAEIANRLKTENIASIAVGTKIDADAIAALRSAAPEIIDLCGKTNLHKLAALARHAVCVIGNDTGPVHLAAAVGVPTLALMSEHVDPVWSAPQGPHARWLQGKPLGTLGVDEVLVALKKLIGDNA